MYKAIERFKDLKDDNFVYNVGDKYPRKGKRVSKHALPNSLDLTTEEAEQSLKKLKKRKSD